MKIPLVFQGPINSISIAYWSFILIPILLGCNDTGIQGDADNGGLFLPHGFEAIVVVDSLRGGARHLAVNVNGDIYVKIKGSKKGQRIAAIRDKNGDGKGDVVRYFGEYEPEYRYGTAMRIHNGYLYFSSETAVYRQELKARELVPSSPLETVVQADKNKYRKEHQGKPIAFDDQGHIYVPFGASSNACQDPKRTPGAPGRDPCPQLGEEAGIWRFNANLLNQSQDDGLHFATGIRSVVGMDWNPRDRELYVLQHGRDDLFRLFREHFSPWQSALLPSEELLIVREGMDFGWPYCYYDQMQGKKVLAPEYGGDGNIIGRCADCDDPWIGFPGHWAPNDIQFYRGQQFPNHYANGAFIAFHGSTNRAPYPQAGYIIAFVPPKGNGIDTTYEIFADGFSQVDPIVNVSDAVYRPMGVAVGPDGSLYISETEKGKIWRIIYTGDRDQFGSQDLLKMEERKTLAHIRTPDITTDNLHKEEPYSAKVLYTWYCSACHQRNGEGDGNRFPTLVQTDWVIGDKNRLIYLTLNGLEGPIEVNGELFTGAMPQHSFLTNSEVAEVLTFVRENFGNDATPITPEEVKAVRDNIESTQSR